MPFAVALRNRIETQSLGPQFSKKVHSPSFAIAVIRSFSMNPQLKPEPQPTTFEEWVMYALKCILISAATTAKVRECERKKYAKAHVVRLCDHPRWRR